MKPLEETIQASEPPRPELAALSGTLAPENPKSFTNAMDLVDLCWKTPGFLCLLIFLGWSAASLHSRWRFRMRSLSRMPNSLGSS